MVRAGNNLINCSYIYGTVVEEDDPAVQKTMFAEFQQLLETLKSINRWVGYLK